MSAQKPERPWGCVGGLARDSLDGGGDMDGRSLSARRIAGKRSLEIEAILGYRGRDEIIHRDNFVLLEELG